MSLATSPALMPSQGAAKSPRVTWLDTFRGLTITLVVLGHVLSGLAYAKFVQESDRRALWQAYDLVFTFRMPALFLASGLFAARSLRRGLPNFLGDKTRTLAYPYLLWSLISWACYSVASGVSTNGIDPMAPFKMLYNPMQGVWFLYTLFVMMVGYGIWATRGGGLRGLLAIGVLMHLLVPLCEAAPSMLVQIARYGIYFVAGLLLANPIRTLGDRLSVSALLGLVPIFFVMMKGAVALKFDTKPWLDFVPAFFGTSAMFGLAILLDRLPIAEFLRYIGRHSLQIYVASEFGSLFIMILLQRGLGVSALPIHIALGTIAGLLLPLALVAVCNGVGFRYLFTWPKPVARDHRETGARDQVPSVGKIHSRDTTHGPFSLWPRSMPG